MPTPSSLLSLLSLLLGGPLTLVWSRELQTTANLTLYYESDTMTSSMTSDSPIESDTLYYDLAAGGGGPLIVARDAIGAAVAHVESSDQVVPSAGGSVQQVVVEVNTLWAPFAESCSRTNATQTSATWRCEQPALRGPLNGSDSIICDCNQHSMSYPLAVFARKCACHRMLELAVGRLDLNRSAQLMLANDTLRALSRGLRSTLGGTVFSLQDAGHCGGGSDDEPCTWRIISHGSSVDRAAISATLRQLATKARGGADCYSSCSKPDQACHARCTAAGLGAAGPAAVEAAWLKLFATTQAKTTVSYQRSTERLTTGTQRMELYRLAPVALAVDLVNADSGDAAGDVFFGVMEAQLQCYNSAKHGEKPKLFSCQDDPMSEGKALRLGTAVYTRFTVDVNSLWSDYTMCNAVPAGGYTCVPEWNCACLDSTGGNEGGGGETCGCVGWGSGSMHLPHDAPAFWRNHSFGVGRNDVEAEWGSTGGGHMAENCSIISSKRACTETRSCKWSDAYVGARAADADGEARIEQGEGSRCENEFVVAEALTCAADRVGGYWYSTQGPGENTSWQVVEKTVGAFCKMFLVLSECRACSQPVELDLSGPPLRLRMFVCVFGLPCDYNNLAIVIMPANATCVNAAVNKLVDSAGAAACREQRRCQGDGSYPRDGEERNCWVECFASTVIGSNNYPGTVKWVGAPTAGLSQPLLVQAFEAAFQDGGC